MKLNAPKQLTFIISLVLAVLGLIGTLITIPVVSMLAPWLLLAGYVLLALSAVLKGL